MEPVVGSCFYDFFCAAAPAAKTMDAATRAASEVCKKFLRSIFKRVTPNVRPRASKLGRPGL